VVGGVWGCGGWVWFRVTKKPTKRRKTEKRKGENRRLGQSGQKKRGKSLGSDWKDTRKISKQPKRKAKKKKRLIQARRERVATCKGWVSCWGKEKEGSIRRPQVEGLRKKEMLFSGKKRTLPLKKTRKKRKKSRGPKRGENIEASGKKHHPEERKNSQRVKGSLRGGGRKKGVKGGYLHRINQVFVKKEKSKGGIGYEGQQ